MQNEQTQLHTLRSKHQAIASDLTSQERQDAEGVIRRIEVAFGWIFRFPH